MTNNDLAQFDHQKYLSIETYRKSGQGVATPVWFAESDDGLMYIYTLPDAGKVKRIRNNPKVRVAPCDMRGRITGDWVEGTARVEDEDGARLGQRLLNQKYWTKRVGDFFSRLAGRKQAVISVRVSWITNQE